MKLCLGRREFPTVVLTPVCLCESCRKVFLLRFELAKVVASMFPLRFGLAKVVARCSCSGLDLRKLSQICPCSGLDLRKLLQGVSAPVCHLENRTKEVPLWQNTKLSGKPVFRKNLISYLLSIVTYFLIHYQNLNIGFKEREKTGIITTLFLSF